MFRGAVGIGMLITALSFLLTWAAVPAMMGEQKRAFSRDGFFFATPEIAQHFRWSAVQRVVETDEFLLLFVAPAAAHYIPKRAIPVESETPLRALLADVFADRPKRLLLQAWAD